MPGETPEEFGLRAAQALEEEIIAVGPENVAAFAGEPVQGAGGVKIAPSTYWPEIQRIIAKYDILFLADEVITAFGRLGKWFGSEYYGLKPDLITFAKGATSGYIPLSGVLLHDRVVEVFWDANDDFNHGHTFSGHPVACAVGLKNIELIERDQLIDYVSTFAAPALSWMLASLSDHPLVGEVRSIGLLGAIELMPHKTSRRRFDSVGRVGLLCRNHFFNSGFIMRALGDTMVMCPPLVWKQEHFDEAAVLARRALDLTYADVKGEMAV